MTISEMHVWFRQYAQQMGMQNVRAILPEQIDNLINTSIKDTIDEVVNRNVGTTNDRVITDNSKLANINALRTLYKVKTIAATGSGSVASYANTPYSFDSSVIENALYFVDFAIRYTSGSKLTRWFPIRIIDDSYLADVLNDWVLSPRMRTPVMVVYKGVDSSEATLEAAVAQALADYNAAVAGFTADPPTKTQEEVAAAKAAYDTAVINMNNYRNTNVELTQFDVYLGENDFIADIAGTATIANIRCSYIKKPNEVHYLSDIGGQNVDSDLPEQLQIPMLKHAVDLYRVSLQGALYANQQNAQQNQQELVRNNARPDNDGYQS